jgi:hypothetical protein
MELTVTVKVSDLNFGIDPENADLTDALDHNLTEIELHDLNTRITAIQSRVRNALARKHTRQRHEEARMQDAIVKSVHSNR